MRTIPSIGDIWIRQGYPDEKQPRYLLILAYDDTSYGERVYTHLVLNDGYIDGAILDHFERFCKFFQ